MEFNEKLQELRKQKALTQEELAEKLFVSRTAVSKWESGRGYPNIESLKAKTDFSEGPVWKRIVAQAIPLTVAQLVQLLYNVVDRIYLGHMGDGDSMALTGVGLTFPVVSLIMAFTALFGNGGVPLFSIKRGAGDDEAAGRILGNSFALLLVSSLILTVAGYAFARPVLFAFGAGESSYAYAKEYLDIYLLGTVFSMLATGMNGYINAQGFPKIGMWCVTLGAACNIALDPVFIFGLRMGVSGAALATVISQAVSAIWALIFLTGKRALIPLRRSNIKIGRSITKDICKLGVSNFIMQGTTCLVQVTCNSTLQTYGGDLYIGIMTVTNSVREIFMLPVMGIVSGAQPVISFNYGAKRFERVRSGIRFNTLIGTAYTLIAWLLVILFPSFWFGIFSDDAQMAELGIKAMKVYFFGFVFMSLQFAGQSTFQALGDAKHAVFFSLLRKAIIVVPLTLLLPKFGLGVMGVFAAEPVSNIVGGAVCYLTMRMTVYREINRKIKSDIITENKNE
ncbi:MAG: MATE family efflux transporter [Ruminococcaceae bacterium]|nr:MATE family efflux transporter [Oscillospiraceae bacterium]